MLKKLNRKQGFTLAELLIVVAIIAVLVAISIPIFTTKLEASRESTDAANLRAAYAAGTTALLNGKDDEGTKIDFSDGNVTLYYNKKGFLSAERDDAMKGKSQINGYQGADLDDLPAGVFLYAADSSSFDPSKNDAVVEANLGNSDGGDICVILKEKASSVSDYNVVVFFDNSNASGG